MAEGGEGYQYGTGGQRPQVNVPAPKRDVMYENVRKKLSEQDIKGNYAFYYLLYILYPLFLLSTVIRSKLILSK